MLYRIPIGPYVAFDRGDDGSAVDVTYRTPAGQVVKRIAFADGLERAIVDRDGWLHDFGFRAGRVDNLGTGALKEPGLVCIRGTRATPWSDCNSALLDPTSLERQLGTVSCWSPE